MCIFCAYFLLIGHGRHNQCKYAEISLNMHEGKYAIICKLKLEYAEICTKYAVPICKKYTQICKKKNMQYMCKISNMHKSAFYVQICVLYA